MFYTKKRIQEQEDSDLVLNREQRTGLSVRWKSNVESGNGKVVPPDGTQRHE